MRLNPEQDNSLKLRLEELFAESAINIEVVDILCLSCVDDNYIVYFSYYIDERLNREEVTFFANRSSKGFTNFKELE